MPATIVGVGAYKPRKLFGCVNDHGVETEPTR
jgi:hypothetical protein